MASSMIHLAITEAMIKQADFQDFKRLRLGAILPDGAVRGNSHLKRKSSLMVSLRLHTHTIWNFTAPDIRRR